MLCPRCAAPLSPEGSRCPRCGTTSTYHLTDAVGPDPLVRTGVASPGTVPARVLPSGAVLPGGVYQVKHVIAEGGMGVVYRARDHALGRDVAIKALHTNLLGNVHIRRRFLREAAVLVTTLSHPNVATLYDTISHDDVLAIVMELVEGPTLREAISSWQGRMPMGEIVPIALGCLEALQAAHDRRIVHRDVKPGNILLAPRPDGTWQAKLIDFGIAKVLEGTTYTVTGALLGTCRYMSPEQVQHPEQVGHLTDVYSFGVTLYEALTGQAPFDDPGHFNVMMAHVTRAPDPPSLLRPDLDPGLEHLVLACLAKDPAGRPQSCAEVADRLRALFPDLEQAARVAPPAASVVAHSAGGELVLVPHGVFQMGAERREVTLDGFYLARHPVTNAQFDTFLRATGYRPRGAEAQRFLAHWPGGRPPGALLHHPVVYVSWFDASAYASWAGLRLPTEAEWEKAARGVDGRRFPWGRSRPGAEHANFARRVGSTTEVGAHPEGASPFGILDLAGNVWEWCDEVDDPAFYASGPARNPHAGPVLPEGRAVVRGGAWMFDAGALRTWSRSGFAPQTRTEFVGFRCARDQS